MHAIRIYRNEHGDTRVQYANGNRIEDVGRDESLGFYIPRTLSAAIYDDRCVVPWLATACHDIKNEIPRGKNIFVRDIHEYIELCQVLGTFDAKWMSNDPICGESEYYIHMYHLAKFEIKDSDVLEVCVCLHENFKCTIARMMYNAKNENHLRWGELKEQILNNHIEGERYEY